MSHVERAEEWIDRARDEMNAGHIDTAQACATLATAFATLALARAPRAGVKREPSECAYKQNHPYMSEPCPLCGFENGAGR